MKRQKAKEKIVQLNPQNEEEREQIIRASVKRTVEEYGEALKMLGDE
jgi:hypothetical protein